MARTAMIVGAVTGAWTLLLFLGLLIRHLLHWPSEAAVPIWKRMLPCFYGGIDKELLLRLFLLSLALWLVRNTCPNDWKAGVISFGLQT